MDTILYIYKRAQLPLRIFSIRLLDQLSLNKLESRNKENFIESLEIRSGLQYDASQNSHLYHAIPYKSDNNMPKGEEITQCERITFFFTNYPNCAHPRLYN